MKPGAKHSGLPFSFCCSQAHLLCSEGPVRIQSHLPDCVIYGRNLSSLLVAKNRLQANRGQTMKELRSLATQHTHQRLQPRTARETLLNKNSDLIYSATSAVVHEAAQQLSSLRSEQVFSCSGRAAASNSSKCSAHIRTRYQVKGVREAKSLLLSARHLPYSSCHIEITAGHPEGSICKHQSCERLPAQRSAQTCVRSTTTTAGDTVLMTVLTSCAACPHKDVPQHLS